jgi:hypothetical protein
MSSKHESAMIPHMPKEGMVRGSTVSDDMLVILMERSEKKIREELSKINEELHNKRKAVQKAYTDLEKRFRELGDKEAAEAGKVHVDALKGPLAKIGADLECVVTTAAMQYAFNSKKQLIGHVCIGHVCIGQAYEGKNNKRKFGDGNRSYMTFSFYFKPSKEILELEKERKAIDNDFSKLYKKQSLWHNRLNNLPRLQKTYRANIATARLKNIEGAEDLMETIGKQIDKDLKSLDK